MAFTLVDRTPTVTTSEYSIPGDTTTGVPTSQTDDAMMQIVLDLNALAAGDEFELSFYEKATSGGTQRKVDTIRFVGPQPPYWVPAFIVAHGWDATLKKITGTDRSIPCSLRKVT